MAANGSFTLSANALFMNVGATNNIYCSSNGSSNTPCYSWQQNSNTGMYWASSNVIGFSAGGSNKMVIGSNMGIGTTTPLSALHVAGTTTLLNSVPTSNLVAYYPFDADGTDTFGTRTLSGSGYTTMVGKVGQAIRFTHGPTGASPQRLKLLSTYNLSSPLSFAYWFYPEGDSADFQFVSNLYNSVGGIAIQMNGVEQLMFNILGVSTTITSLTLNTWYHLAVTSVSGGAYTVYLNGVLVASGVSGTYSAFTDFVVGGNESASTLYQYAYKGAIDDLRIYNRILSAAEVNLIYQNQLGGSSIYTDSRLGVGVANPQYALDVAGGARFSGSLIAPLTWVNVTFATNFQNYDTTFFFPVSVAKDMYNCVRLRGFGRRVAGSGNVSSGTIFTVPTGYAPAKEVIFTITTNTSTTPIEVRINSSGNLTIAVGTINASDQIRFDNVFYVLDL